MGREATGREATRRATAATASMAGAGRGGTAPLSAPPDSPVRVRTTGDTAVRRSTGTPRPEGDSRLRPKTGGQNSGRGPNPGACSRPARPGQWVRARRPGLWTRPHTRRHNLSNFLYDVIRTPDEPSCPLPGWALSTFARCRPVWGYILEYENYVRYIFEFIKNHRRFRGWSMRGTVQIRSDWDVVTPSEGASQRVRVSVYESACASRSVGVGVRRGGGVQNSCHSVGLPASPRTRASRVPSRSRISIMPSKACLMTWMVCSSCAPESTVNRPR